MAKEKSITFEQICEGSDCTGPYKVKIRKPMTVRKFINDFLCQYPKEWGYIGIYKSNSIFGDPSCEYSNGKLISKLPDEYLDREIHDVVGSGGWSRSDFLLKLVKEEIENE